MSTATYYERVGKQAILANPSVYAWNCVLYFLQFTQDELLSVREWIELREMIRYQRSVTVEFLRTHFAAEIDASLEVDWADVERFCVR
jgi:hypothetical protein